MGGIFVSAASARQKPREPERGGHYGSASPSNRTTQAAQNGPYARNDRRERGGGLKPAAQATEVVTPQMGRFQRPSARYGGAGIRTPVRKRSVSDVYVRSSRELI